VSFEPTAFLKKLIQDALQCYLDDLDALSNEDLAYSPGGTARCPFDFSYEVAYVNHRVAARLRGEDPGAWPYAEGEWAAAPDEYRSRDAIATYLKQSTQAVLEALGDATREVSLPSGPKSAFEFAMIVPTHLEYHLAQLNYLQSIRGDSKVHWTA